METLNEQIKREYKHLDQKEHFDSEREREEILHSHAAWMRVAKKLGRGLTQSEEMGINI